MSSLDIGIDLGTSMILAGTPRRGVVVREPSVVAVRPKTGELVGIGGEVYAMLGRTHTGIEITRPIESGVISDFEMSRVLLRVIIDRVGRQSLFKPRVICCVPSVISGIESQSVIDAGLAAGARLVCLVDEPVAAALGAGMDFSKAQGMMVVDIGGGTSDFAVLSFGGVVSKHSVRVAGRDFDTAIISHMRRRHNILIGDKTAEVAKIQIGGVYSACENREIEIKGRHLVSGLPAKMKITTEELYPALSEVALEIMRGIQTTLERTPPELVGDIQYRGVVLTGGGSLIGGFDRLIERRLGAPAIVAENAADCAMLGILRSFKFIGEDFDGFVRVSSRM